MIACLGIYTSTALVCDRCSWRDSCPTDTVACTGPWDGEVYTDTTQGEIKAAEDVDEVKVIPAYLPYPAHRVIVDRRRYVWMTAPRRF